MRVSLVCDDLIQFGGAERVVMALHDIWPDAPIYTSVASEKWEQVCKEKNITLVTSFMQKLPFKEKLNRYYSAFLFHIFALESFDFSAYDLVISSSSRFAHGIITKPQTVHICYMHSPGRMFWESQTYFENETYGFLKPIKAVARPFLSFPLSILRVWDRSAAARVDAFIANSNGTAGKIKHLYNKESEVIHPFTEIFRSGNKAAKGGSYFLVITRLLPWKKVETAVRACSELGLGLKIIGTGPDEERLKKMSAPCIQFMGYAGDEEKIKLIDECTALIQTQKEDFGIVPLEVLARGKPVIAYGEGGVAETVTPGKTGEFYSEQSVECLKKVLSEFDPSRYSPEECINSTSLFNKENFTRSVKDLTDNVYLHIHG